VQWLAVAATNLAHYQVGHRREDEADSEEDRAQSSRGNARDERDKAETAYDERDHAEHECQYRQCTRAAVEDQNSTAVIGDDESAGVGEDPRFGRCAHPGQHAERSATSVRSCTENSGVSCADTSVSGFCQGLGGLPGPRLYVVRQAGLVPDCVQPSSVRTGRGLLMVSGEVTGWCLRHAWSLAPTRGYSGGSVS